MKTPVCERKPTRFAALVAVVALVGVASGCKTPYDTYSFWRFWAHGGYEDEKVGDRTYKVQFIGNGHTPKNLVVEYWHRRASELCGGRDRYVITKDETLFVPRSPLMAAMDQNRRAKGTITCVDYPAMLFTFRKNPALERLKGTARPPLRQDGRTVVELRPGVFFISVMGPNGQAAGSAERVFDMLAKGTCTGVGKPFLMRHAYKDVGKTKRDDSAYDAGVIVYHKTKQIRYVGYLMCIWWKPQGRPVREIL